MAMGKFYGGDIVLQVLSFVAENEWSNIHQRQAEEQVEEEAEPEPEEEVEEELEQEEEEAEDEAIVIGLGDTIETDKFTMRFDSVECKRQIKSVYEPLS